MFWFAVTVFMRTITNTKKCQWDNVTWKATYKMCVLCDMWFSTHITHTSEEASTEVYMMEIFFLFICQSAKSKYHRPKVGPAPHLPTSPWLTVPRYHCQGHCLPSQLHHEFVRELDIRGVKCEKCEKNGEMWENQLWNEHVHVGKICA